MPGGAHEYMKAWEPDEDTIILTMVESEGPKWKQIVKNLPGRTVSSVRNRWQRIEKGRKLREEGQELKNRCHACGQPKRGHICQAKLRGGPQVDVSVPGMMHQPVADEGAASSSYNPPGGPRMAAGNASSGTGGQPPLRRTRSGSKLMPDEDPHANAEFAYVSNVGISADTRSRLFSPGMSNMFSPGTIAFYQATFSDSPNDAVASDQKAIAPALQCGTLGASSRESGVEPKLTRSVTSYLREMVDGDGGTPVSAEMPPPSLSRQSSHAAALEPLISRGASTREILDGRSVSSFVHCAARTRNTIEAWPWPQRRFLTSACIADNADERFYRHIITIGAASA